MDSETKVMAGFQLVCPYCGIGVRDPGESAIRLDLNILNEISCDDCNEIFTAAEAARVTAVQAERWTNVARWIASAQSYAPKGGEA